MSAMLTETTAGTRKRTVSEKIRLPQLEPPATPGPPPCAAESAADPASSRACSSAATCSGVMLWSLSAWPRQSSAEIALALRCGLSSSSLPSPPAWKAASAATRSG